jgi:phosphoribosyl 1,2-cyclic phosphate phosphodiesterase
MDELNKNLRVTFLGTGTSQGVPLIACECHVCASDDVRDKRLRSSVLIESSQTTLVIDTGPDFRQQMLSNKVKRLDAVVFTHEHKDHLAGLDDIRAFNFISGKAMEVYATERVQKTIRKDFDYIFHDKPYPGIPKISLHTIGLSPFRINELELIPIETMHYMMPVLGFRIGDFTYITDAKTISEQETEKIKGTKVLVLNALRKESHISHFTLDEAIAFSNKINADKVYFTHISHQMGKHAEINAEIPEHIEIAYDGLQIEI